MEVPAVSSGRQISCRSGDKIKVNSGPPCHRASSSRGMSPKGSELFDEMRPVLVASRALGVAPWGRDLRISLPLALYSAAFMVANLSLGGYIGVQMNMLNSIFSLSLFSLVLERFQALVVVATIVVSVTMCFLNGGKLACLAESMSRVDARLSAFGLVARRRSCLPLTLGRLLLLVSLPVVGFAGFHTYSSFKTITVEYICFVPLAVANMVQVQFITLLSLVTSRVLLLTRHLKKLSACRSHPATVHKLEAMASVHSSLIAICEIVQSMFSPQILIVLSSIFIITTANLYHVIDKTVKFLSGQKDDVNVLLIISYRIFVRSYEVWALIASAVDASTKVVMLYF
ncbi:hypothetical protein AAG570_008664 [Ranatra chinensis]|uniref:Gustatory receptor n=1 Tax=Ranatra chinensis TaxID=642074 RepID=A0ABD0YRL3_9HEMI